MAACETRLAAQDAAAMSSNSTMGIVLTDRTGAGNKSFGFISDSHRRIDEAARGP